MSLIWGIILVLLGLVMVIAPGVFYDITEGWKNNGQGEPSKLFVISTRIGGSVCCLVGLFGIVISFL